MSRPTLLAAALAILGLAGGASVPVLLDRERTWRDEAAALRGQHDPARLAADSLRDATDATRRTLVAARLRAASRAEATLHLELQRDSGRLLLVRDGIELRRMPVRLTGPLPPVGVRALAALTEVVADSAPVVDSLGNPVRDAVAVTRATVDRVRLDDGTRLVAGDASDALAPSGAFADVPAGDGASMRVARDTTGAVTVPAAEGAARTIVLSRRDLAAIRPNLVTGMKLFTW